MIDCMFRLLRLELFSNIDINECEKSIELISLKQLYLLSKSHDISHIVGAAIGKLNVKDNELKDNFDKQQILAVYRYERSKYELNQISILLNENNIEFIPLKGSVLRDYYPEPWMRTSCDIDILIHRDDLEKAKELFIQKFGYKLHFIGDHDIGLFAPSGIHVELHYSLIEEGRVTQADIPLKQVWNYSKPTAIIPMMYEMSKDMFYYYHIAHMAKHFLIGGCGIRPFIDLYVMREKLKFDDTQKQQLLSQGSLLKFAEQVETLCSVWFDGQPHTDLTRNMQDYILLGGVYGTTQNRVAIQQTQRGGKFRYALSRIWLPLNTLKFQYPVLNRYKWLLPICEVRRWFRLAFCGSLEKAKKEFEINSNLTEDKAIATRKLLKELEL